MKIGPFTFITDLGVSIGEPDSKWWTGFYADLPWGDEHKLYGAPIRVSLRGPLGSVTFGYPYYETVAESAFGFDQKVGWTLDRIQRWSPKRGYHPPRKWSWITYEPPRHWRCTKEVGQPLYPSAGTTKMMHRLGHAVQPRRFQCGRLKWHRGPCYGGIPMTWQLVDGAAYAYDLI